MKMKKTTAAFTAIAIIYTIWYMHYGNPLTNDGALSKIGLEHRILFAIWGVATYSALAANIVLAYKRYTKTRVHIPLLIISGIGMTLTLGCRFDFDIKAEYYLHCTGSLLFSAIMGISVFLLFFLCRKRKRIFKVFMYLSGGLLLTDLVLLLIYKETGLIEAVPIVCGCIMLTAINLRKGDEYETARKAEQSEQISPAYAGAQKKR